MSESARSASSVPAEAAGEPAIVRNEARSRYEARIDGHLAGRLEYVTGDRSITFTHTITEPQFGGRGVGGALAKAGLDDAVGAGLSIVPECTFIAGYIAKHPQYQPHVAGAARG